MTELKEKELLQAAADLATAMQTGIFTGRTQIVYSYGCYGYTRGGGATWHGGLDLVGLDDAFIRMPPYMGKKAIQGTVTRARIVTDHNDKTWEWGWYICVQLDAGQTPDEVNFLYFCHCKEILVKVGQKVKTGDILGIMGQTGNAAGGYDHCHFEVRATATGTGLDPTAYAGVPNAAGTYGSAEDTPAEKVPVDELDTIQLVTVGPLSAGEAARVAALAGSLLLGADRYSMLQVDAAHFAAAMTLSNGDAVRVVQLAEKEGWDKRKLYHSRFVG
ncbi:M23 family metallopeptidase [uncultured Subdoligranulum sp.]|uniref:M23 family metallopeptidase n=1 Tax=uncultured Subdoligranulum sp. TaxID=512298 RepID=UPI00262EB051|nr:peptidoglycan DD-metalloendopeptidase family protein [uncultured Subdoligranulum sp.]